MYFKKSVGLLASTFLLSTASFAENNDLYVSAEAGWSNMASGQVIPYSFHYKKHFGYRAAMGYLFPIKTRWKLGPEIAYGYYGLVSYENPTNLVAFYESTGWSILANLQYALSGQWSLYFKAGETAVYQQYDIKGPNVTPGGFYERKINPTFIVATSYAVTPHFDVSLSYLNILGEKAPLSGNAEFTFTNVDQITRVSAVMLGIVYRV